MILEFILRFELLGSYYSETSRTTRDADLSVINFLTGYLNVIIEPDRVKYTYVDIND